MFVSWRSVDIGSNREADMFQNRDGYNGSEDPRWAWQPLHCTHRGPDRRAHTAVVLHNSRIEGKKNPTQDVIVRLPSIRTCCLADSFVRAAWWWSADEILKDCGIGPEHPAYRFIERDRPKMKAALEEVVSKSTRAGKKKFEAFRLAKEAEARKAIEEHEERLRQEEERRQQAERQEQEDQRRQEEERTRAGEEQARRRQESDDVFRRHQESRRRERDRFWGGHSGSGERSRAEEPRWEEEDEAEEQRSRREEPWEWEEPREAEPDWREALSAYFAFMGLPTSASEGEVKKRFRELVWEYHPDRAGDEAKMKKLNEAKEKLGRAFADHRPKDR